MHPLLKFSFIATVPVVFAGLAAQSSEAATLGGAATRLAPAQSHSPIEKIACNGTWGKYCGPGLHRVCTANGCSCVACGGGGAGGGYGYGNGWYGYGGGWGGWGGGGWNHRGWHHHFWHHGHHGHHGTHHHFHHHHHHHSHHHHHHHGHHGHHGGHRSDIRLKQDIVPLARLDNGLELYRFRYKGSDHTAYVGVMAQEVQKIKPRSRATATAI
jgi:hypothetical protein